METDPRTHQVRQLDAEACGNFERSRSYRVKGPRGAANPPRTGPVIRFRRAKIQCPTTEGHAVHVPHAVHPAGAAPGGVPACIGARAPRPPRTTPRSASGCSPCGARGSREADHPRARGRHRQTLRSFPSGTRNGRQDLETPAQRRRAAEGTGRILSGTPRPLQNTREKPRSPAGLALALRWRHTSGDAPWSRQT